MEFHELKSFITAQDKRLKEYESCSEDKRILAATVKLTEELGELCQEVLAHQSLQRKEKLQNHNNDNLQKEFADVIITTLILAERMNVDIETALEQKIEIIKKRFPPKKCGQHETVC